MGTNGAEGSLQFLCIYPTDGTFRKSSFQRAGFVLPVNASLADSIDEMGQSTTASRSAGAGVGKNTLFAFTQNTQITIYFLWVKVVPLLKGSSV